MPTRILYRNRVIYYSSDFRHTNWKRGVPRTKSGEIKDCARAIPPTSPASPFRAGVALWDREERVSYRCVSNLDPLLGWAPTDFWQRRWGVDHKSVIAFVEHGYLDAAVLEHSQVKKYRCRDEYALKQTEAWKKARRRAASAKQNAKRLRREQIAGKDRPWR